MSKSPKIHRGPQHFLFGWQAFLFTTVVLIILLSTIFVPPSFLKVGEPIETDSNQTFSHPQSQHNTRQESPTTTSTTMIASGGALFCKLAAAEGNVVVSPMSILIALGMTTAGTSDGSKTQSELRHFLGHSALGGNEDDVHKTISGILTGIRGADSKVDLTVANSAWVSGEVLARFRDVCSSAFASEVLPLGSADDINRWVSAATKGLIPAILTEPPPGPAVLVNAVHFKGAWSVPFKKELSHPAKFKPFAGPEVECVMMVKDDKKTLYAETATAQVVVVPYGETRRFVAVLALPLQPGPKGLDEAMEALLLPRGGAGGHSMERVMEWVSPAHVRLQLPRFKASYGPVSLKPALQALGVSEAFGPAGGFLRMAEDPTVFIQDVLHKAVIEVNEEGTTAAAATAVVMTRSLSMPEEVTADRPFLFAVFDTAPAGAGLLFAAKVVSLD